MTTAAPAPEPATRIPPGREPLRDVLAVGVRNPVQLLLLAAIRVYQLTASPLLGPVCRFYPSCSCYGFEAIRVHGALRGTGYTVGRLLRCHPWNPGGIDLVPRPVPSGARTAGRRRAHPSDATARRPAQGA